MTGLVVTGYASVDYIINLDSEIKINQTTIIEDRPRGSWPRAGGCPTYLASAVAKYGQTATPIMWIGTDTGSSSIANSLIDLGINTDGLAILEMNKSPTAMMIYQPDGSSYCLYDPAFSKQEKLSINQVKLIKNADFVCITAGPGQLQQEIFSLIPEKARVYWAVKNDPNCFNTNLCKKLSERADIIFCNASERKMISKTNATIAETMGKDGIKIVNKGKSVIIKVNQIDISEKKLLN